MSSNDTAHAWWSRLRHQGLLLSPVVLVERFPEAPESANFYHLQRLRDAHTRFVALTETDESQSNKDLERRDVLDWTDSVVAGFLGHDNGTFAKQGSIPETLTTTIRIGSRTETLKPDRVIFSDEDHEHPTLLLMADTSPHVGRGRGRNTYSRFLDLLRGTGQRLGLLTNGRQFRLVYAGLDFESWTEWESSRWFEDEEGSEELLGLHQILSPDQFKPTDDQTPILLSAIEESRKRQADLSSVLRENVRQAIEILLDEISAANRADPDLLKAIYETPEGRRLTDAEVHDALLQASVRVVMRLVVCLFAESRENLLPVGNLAYDRSYGVRTLYELLEESVRHEGGTHGLFNRRSAWPRLVALFRLIHGGSAHKDLTLPAYRGALFRPGDQTSPNPVSRALSVFEGNLNSGSQGIADATIHKILRKLLRGPLPVIRGRSKTYVEGPVDYTGLRTEFIGLIYEGVLDYQLKRVSDAEGAQIFLNIGREPVLPLKRLEDMLADDKKGLKDLLTQLKKEKVTAGPSSEEGEEESEETEEEEAEEEPTEEIAVEAEGDIDLEKRDETFLETQHRAQAWVQEAALLTGEIKTKKKKESDSEYQKRLEEEAAKLIKRVVAPGEFFLVRAGNTRKGTGTFYTPPQLAVPTVHRTLEPLCFDKDDQGKLIPKRPEDILGLKVCDPSCGSASFLVAALHYLTDALYASLRYHCGIEDPDEAAKITLPYGRQRTGKGDEQILPFPPDDPQRGHTFEERVKALLRRHVVERCIYGVDINPLAVEFARVSLWIETLDRELPFTFLDHKIKVGNSLVGCWLDRVLDYPIKAWEREGGDGKKGERTQRIETFLKGDFAGKRRTGDGVIKQEMRSVIQQKLFPLGLLKEMGVAEPPSVADAARDDYETLHAMPVIDPDARERFYREHVENSETWKRLKRAMDEWCAVWFWPMDDDSAKSVPTPMSFHQDNDSRQAVLDRVVSEMKFFHWEIEFPDVFTADRQGFDATLGNPPWEVMKPNSQEFFTEYDPIYRTYDKQAALRKQQEFFESDPNIQTHWDDYNARFKALSNWVKNGAEAFEISLARGNLGKELAGIWEDERKTHSGYANPKHPFQYEGSADLNLYKLFAEISWGLLKNNSRLGIILPSGIYSDFGTKDLRTAFLFQGQLEFLYAFQNEKRVFPAAHHAYRQTALVATKGGRTNVFHAQFRMGVGNSPAAHEIPDDILVRRTSLSYTVDDVKLGSPNTLSIIEYTRERGLLIARNMLGNSHPLGDNASGLNVEYSREFDLTNDSKLFAPLDNLKQRGYQSDVFGRWVDANGDVALPLYEGRMIGQFDISQKGWVSGRGRTAVWREIPHDSKAIEPQFLMPAGSYTECVPGSDSLKVAFMDIASATVTRTMVSTVHTGVPFGNSAPTLRLADGNCLNLFSLSAIFNSLSFDFLVRQRLAGLHLNWYIVEETRIPSCLSHDSVANPMFRCLALACASLTLIHRCFAPVWLSLRRDLVKNLKREWKHFWAVTEADRLRMRVEVDALCADLYGLDPDDFDWIVRDDPTDAKSFYRVERELPFGERLTGLAAKAFRTLKEGKWKPETVGELSNDEFFDLLSIPELTNLEAAKQKGHDRPLIEKRKGCHSWKPEDFPEDDPRHGWTWEDCHRDAVALLGSEQALEEYLSEESKANEIPKKKKGESDKIEAEQGELF